MRILKKILLYTGTLLHLPFTLVRVVVASTLLVDLWCDKILKLCKIINTFTKQKMAKNLLWLLHTKILKQQKYGLEKYLGKGVRY